MIITNTSEDRRKGDENRYSHKVKKDSLIYNFLLPKILNNEGF